ncbi:unnamed protein product [Closterium sp. NIES-64]|nr:unnamed protein product [Closterium sp. NIES-64]
MRRHRPAPSCSHTSHSRSPALNHCHVILSIAPPPPPGGGDARLHVRHAAEGGLDSLPRPRRVPRAAPPASVPALLQRYAALPYMTLGMYVFSAHLCEEGPADVWRRLYVHLVDKPATGGVDLSVDDMYFAHLRSLNGKGLACRPPHRQGERPAARRAGEVHHCG